MFAVSYIAVMCVAVPYITVNLYEEVYNAYSMAGIGIAQCHSN